MIIYHDTTISMIMISNSNLQLVLIGDTCLLRIIIFMHFIYLFSLYKLLNFITYF
jgi:hypothetical protein